MKLGTRSSLTPVLLVEASLRQVYRMSRRVEVIISSSAPQDQAEPPLQITESKPGEHPGVKGFLMIKPAVLGWLEILTGAGVFGLVYWNYTLWLLIPACFVILIGVITATAACTHNPCLVITSQVLNLLNVCNVVTAVLLFFVRVFFVFLGDIVGAIVRTHFLSSRSESSSSQTANIAFIACNVLALIFSLIIIVTSCCWCRSRKRLMVIHMNAASPAALSDDVDYLCPELSPPAYSPVPSSDPPAYEEERRSTLSGVSTQKWAMRKWKEELQRSRKPIQV
ncbi:uncharacterized protein LOC107673328 isoform X2 [Sinocyclocheilus anshuiensis]|uniref:uncharacterized protein LOC107673328 isoform X2 n=1 Tax=Sinocyclocheilus anshuiensis TaxID=1608454 RepID=UPI0007B7A6DA|nr:PREDICTED: uncharacterized protein LOC107673328 isoform X2 [Sinocyclocheilus anshuiensis]